MKEGLTPREELIWERIHQQAQKHRDSGFVPIEEMNTEQVNELLESTEKEDPEDPDTKSTAENTNFWQVGKMMKESGVIDFLKRNGGFRKD